MESAEAVWHEAAAAGAAAPTAGGDPRHALRVLTLLKELGPKVTEELLVLMPVLLTSLKDDDLFVVRQSISSGTNLLCTVLEEMALQLRRLGKIEGWLEEIWSWMLKFMNTVCGLTFEPGSLATKLLAVKFLEICVLLFTPDVNDSEVHCSEGMRQNFNVSWLVGNHPVLNPAMLTFEANKIVGLLLGILQPDKSTHGSFTISIINCLAAIAKKRPIHYDSIRSALIAFDSNFESLKGGHPASIRYSLRTAFLGFIRCPHPSFIQSRDQLTRILRSMNPGKATDQIIRQMEKMSRNIERGFPDNRLNKDETSAGQMSLYEDAVKKRALTQPNDASCIADDPPAKRTRFNASVISSLPVQLPSDFVQDDEDDGGDDDINVSAKGFVINSNLTPVEKMISMIVALLAEGERGSESLQILISNIHADLMADIVLENMRNLASTIRLCGKEENLILNSQASPSNVLSQIGSTPSTTSIQSSPLSSQAMSTAVTMTDFSIPTTDVMPNANLLSDSKRDPRRDPRRLDPRRVVAPVVSPSVPSNLESASDTQSGLYQSSSNAIQDTEVINAENAPASLISKSELEQSDILAVPTVNSPIPGEGLVVHNVSVDREPIPLNVQTHGSMAHGSMALSPVHVVDQELAVSTPSDLSTHEGVDGDIMESEQYCQSVSAPLIAEDVSHSLPSLPLYMDLTDEQKKSLHKIAVARIIEDCKQARATHSSQAGFPLIARLIAQINAADDIVLSLQEHIISDYHNQKGHELAMHVLYRLHSITSELDGESSLFASNIYEKFLLSVAKSLLDSLPAADKSFSKLLGEAPLLPDSTLILLEDLCHSHGYDHHGREIYDGDRITQGLGVVWSLILGRPPNRQACLDIALKCAVHSQDEVRAKAIRLVANKLYPLSFATENIEQFATTMLLSVVDQRVSESELKPAEPDEQRLETGNQETSVAVLQNSELAATESESMKSSQPSSHNSSVLSLSQAQQKTSLFFAVCTKKPSLLRLVFNIYGRSPKAFKQSIHRHIPVLLRTLGSSYSELLQIISDPPDGCLNLIMLVLETLTEEMTPSADLIAAVKCLYETKLKDATVLIPMLSSLSKDEVLPIFPRLIDLSLEKFQSALARILQGSAHSGPALTPVEVLIAIHSVRPEKDAVALKKIMDACTACFEQRTVFTQHVLEKVLSHLVEQVPLPLLFMRTVIQAIDAFPALVDFVMGVLSKLVSKQVWKMPKLWVGFLKCVSQTQPHSFHVLLQLPPPQLESALNRHANLRGPLAAYASQPNINFSLPRPTMVALGLITNDLPQQAPRSFLSTSLHSAEADSSVRGATLT